MFLDQEIPRPVVGMLAAFGAIALVGVIGFLIGLARTYLTRPPAWAVLLVFAIGLLGLTGFGLMQWQCHVSPSAPPSYATKAADEAYHRDIAERQQAIVVPWAGVIPLTLMSGASCAACFILAIENRK